MEFGEAVRQRRQLLGLSQSALAERSGISKAMLSEIESGKKNPTLRVACSISDGLECQISDLLDLPPDVPFQKLTREQRKVLVDPSNGVERHLLAPPMVRHGLQVLLYVLPPGAEVDFIGDGRGVLEHVHCIEGRVRVSAGTCEAELDEDEGVTYEAVDKHVLANPLDRESRALVVIDSTRRGQAVVADAGL